MIADLRPYGDTRDSRVSWLGEVPDQWKVLPGRACYRERAIPNSGMQESQVLSLSFGRIVVKSDDRLRGLVPESFETYQIVEPRDIVVRPTDLQNDWNSLRFALSPHRGIITSAYICLRTQGEMTREYGYLLLHAYDLKKIFYGLGSGLRQNLDWEDFKSLPCLVPPVAEQDAVVRFLDHADRRIRRATRAKQKMIALLNEQKQAVIHRAVTRGLDPNVRLKPSGMDWLGDVPVHWEVWRIGRLGRIGNGSTPSRSHQAYWDGGTRPWLNSSSVNRGRIRHADQFVTDLALQECHLPRLTPGTLLVAITGQGRTRGTAAILEMEATINQHMAYIAPDRDRVISEYLRLSLIAAYPELRRISDGSGSTKGALTCGDLSQFKVALPPQDEQGRIVAAVETSVGEIERAIAGSAASIDLLNEYRSRLITDVVTGRLDVRDAAASLPEESRDSELLDDIAVEQMAEPDVEGLEPIEA